MMNVCYRCGLYRADKVIDPDGPYAICPECGHKHPFLRLPLLIVTGASGTGKSTACQHLLGKLKEVVLLEADLLWRPEFNKPEDKYRDFFETWLRICKNISQAGRPVTLFCAGAGVPENVETRVERRYFSDLHCLALTCDDNALVERLKRRPAWRKCNDPAYVDEHVQFNRWFKETRCNMEPPIELLDTSTMPAEETAKQVASWIYRKMRELNNKERQEVL